MTRRLNAASQLIEGALMTWSDGSPPLIALLRSKGETFQLKQNALSVTLRWTFSAVHRFQSDSHDLLRIIVKQNMTKTGSKDVLCHFLIHFDH